MELCSALRQRVMLRLWDAQTRELFLARDRIGVKPLYYTTRNGIFAFSSEIKALLTPPSVKRELDEEAFYDFLTFNRIAPPATAFHPGLRGEAALEPPRALLRNRSTKRVDLCANRRLKPCDLLRYQLGRRRASHARREYREPW